MLLSDIVYQTIKGCVWFNREISKEILIKEQTYQEDIDIGTFVNNVYVALNDAFSSAYVANKVGPISVALEKVEDVEEAYKLPTDVYTILNVYSINKANKIKNYNYSSKNNIIYVKNNKEGAQLFLEYVKNLPYLVSSTLFENDIELTDYGISNALAYVCSELARSSLYRDIDENVAYLYKNVAMSKLNALTDYGENHLNTMTEVDEVYYV